MKAVIVREAGAPCEVRDVEVGEPGAGQVAVRLGASGICHSDLSWQNGMLPWPMPCILGHEGAGIVTAVGAGVTSVQVGDHVILNTLPHCGRCYYCRRGEFHICFAGWSSVEPTHRMDGQPVFPVTGLGTMAEETVVVERAAVPIPKDVPLELAALIGCAVITGVGAAINTARVEPGASVVVFGCGGVGINAIQGAKVCGAATIVGVDRVPAKLAMAKAFGATHAVLPEELADLSQQLTGGIGFDYAFEVIGLASTIRSAWDNTRRGGMTVVVGVGSAEEQVTFSPLELMRNEKRLVGCVYGSANVQRDFPRLIALWRSGQLNLEGLISKRIGLGDVNEAFADMAKGEVIRSMITLS